MAWPCILLGSQLKFAAKLIEFEFSALDPANFRRTNPSGNGTASMAEGGRCLLDFSKSSPASPIHVFTDWTFTARFIMPVLGGTLSSAWLGCNRSLQIGGSLILLATGLMSLLVYLGLICQGSALIAVTWLLVPLFLGLVQPSVLLVMFRWHLKDKYGTVASSIYYAAAALGELVSVLIVQLTAEHNLGRNFPLLFVGVSICFLTITAFLPALHEDEPFELPTQRRLMKYFQVFSALALFLTFFGDSRTKIYVLEMNFFMNKTTDIVAQPWLSPNSAKTLGLLACAPLMILAAVQSRRRLRVPPRILSGIFLKAGVDLALIIVTTVGLKSESATVAVYSIASVLDGFSEFLVMVSAFDLVCSFLPGSAQCLVLGVMFTVWGISNFASRGLLFLANEVWKQSSGSKPLFFIYHLVAVLMLVGCGVYHKVVVLPIAAQIAVGQEEEEPNALGNEAASSSSFKLEEQPLLQPV